MKHIAQARSTRKRAWTFVAVANIILGAFFNNIPRFRGAATGCLAMAAGLALIGAPAYAELTVTPISWDVVGLDHNRPLVSGPQYFPVGAQVCNTSGSAISNVEVEMLWEDGSDATYIYNRPGSLTRLMFDEIGPGECVDAYFEIQLTRSPDAFGETRAYTIVADAPGVDPASTPEGRQIYIERLVSQNRNSTQQIRYGQQADASDWMVLGGGGTMALAVGEKYFIELITETSTAYEEIQSFLTLSNTIFQVLSVETTYSTRTAPEERVPDPNPRLWGDGCLWDSDPDSPNYNSCLSTGKAGGVVTTVYEIQIISGGGESVGLEALIYDRSGGSFHYNSDFSQSPGEVNIISPFAKQFVPSTIAAGGTATLRFTITNPGAAVTGTFKDVLPEGLEMTDPVNASSTCGGIITTGTEGDPERHVIEFEGTIGAASTCTITVDITAAVAGTYNNVSENLFLGGNDTGIKAEATLSVAATPPPGLDCPDESLALWDFSDDSAGQETNPDPVDPPGTTGEAEGGDGLQAYDISKDNEWRAQPRVANQTLQQARNTDAYFEFRVDTTGYDSIDFELAVFRQNPNPPKKMTLYYGPPDNLVESITVDVPQRNEPPAARNFLAHNLGNFNQNGETVFRLYAYDAAGTNQYIHMVEAEIRGTDFDTCVELADPPDSPTISKVFSPETVNAGQSSTLTFTLTNPNETEDNILYVTFRDELPDGMTAVSGTFVNNCSGSNWRSDGDDSVLLFTGGVLGPEEFCTVSVDVVSSTVGVNVNISDPIDAMQTVSGNTATANLTVNPPPRVPPSIIKFFDPNPLVDPTGAATLTFRLTNNDPDNAIASVAFTDALPFVNGVQMAPVTPFSSLTNGYCGAGSLVWDTATYTLSFSGGQVAAGENNVCEIYVDVEVPGVDVDEGYVLFPNETSRVSHVVEETTYYGNASDATLLVDNPIPGISILKQVGLTDDIAEAWYTNMVITPETEIYYLIIVENTGEVQLDSTAVSDPDIDLSGCTWTSPLPTASADSDNHITTCIIGPVTAEEGTHPNTATATGAFGGTNFSDSSTATYQGVHPTAVEMGVVELVTVEVQDFLRGFNVPVLDRTGLLNLLRTWDPNAAARLEGAGREALLAALVDYLDPDGDGRVVVLRWETLEERGTIGFFAERREGGAWRRINAEMLPGLIASPMGAQYRLVDPGARSGDGFQYRLIEVEARGATREYGPFDLRLGE